MDKVIINKRIVLTKDFILHLRKLFQDKQYGKFIKSLVDFYEEINCGMYRCTELNAPKYISKDTGYGNYFENEMCSWSAAFLPNDELVKTCYELNDRVFEYKNKLYCFNADRNYSGTYSSPVLIMIVDKNNIEEINLKELLK